MKISLVLLISILLCSLGACYPASEAPEGIASPVATFRMDTSTPKIISTTSPIIREQGTANIHVPSPMLATDIPTETMVYASPVMQAITMTIVYDNRQDDQRLGSAWGFSALIDDGDGTLLFDTGADGSLLLQNMQILGIDPLGIKSVILSHAHEDHTGGLIALLEVGAKPDVYLLPSFPISFKRQIDQYTNVIEVSPGQSLAAGIWTTGEIGGPVPEQALIIQIDQGLVIITGCAHPGIIRILEIVQDLFNEPMYLVMGGFHLADKSEAEISDIIKDFRRLNVEQVAPCHCTGVNAITNFAEEYGNDFIQVGVGTVLQAEASGLK